MSFKVKKFALVKAMQMSLGIVAVLTAIVPDEHADKWKEGVARYKLFIKEFDAADTEEDVEKVFDKFCADMNMMDPDKKWLDERIGYWDIKLKAAMVENDEEQQEKAMVVITELEEVRKRFY